MPKTFKSFPKSNKSPDLVTLDEGDQLYVSGFQCFFSVVEYLFTRFNDCDYIFEYALRDTYI